MLGGVPEAGKAGTEVTAFVIQLTASGGVWRILET
jgi:hypothetical protein